VCCAADGIVVVAVLASIVILASPFHALYWPQPGSSYGAVLAPRGDMRPWRSGSAVPSSVCTRKAR
jgi:hypothetical protein